MSPSEHEEIERLVGDSRWMRGLARRLVRDGEVANDIVQDALVVAIEGRARVRGGISNFVAGVIRRIASGTRRSDERRARREATATPSGSGDRDVAELAARLEAQRDVAAHLLALAEPYRATLLLRYVEDLKPAAIAARQGVPIATVNSRLARGLALLREKLDRSHGDRESWVRALAPFAVPHSVFGTVVSGVTIMSIQKKVAALAAALVLLVGGGWWMGSGDAVESQSSRVASPAVADSNPVAAPVAATESAPGVDREILAPAISPPRTLDHPCRVRVSRAEDAIPIAGAWVAVARDGSHLVGSNLDAMLKRTGGLHDSFESLIRVLPHAQQTDARGEVTIEGGREVTLIVGTSDRVREVRIERAAATIDVALPIGRFIDVRVVDPHGVAVAGVPVALVVHRSDDFGTIPLLGLQSDATGRARFPVALLENDSLVAGARGGDDGVFAMLALPLANAERRAVRVGGDDVTLTVPSTARVRGRVSFSDGGAVGDGSCIVYGSLDEFGRLGVPYCAAEVRDGFVDLPRVGIGMELVAFAAFGEWSIFGSESQLSIRFRSPDEVGMESNFDWSIPRSIRMKLRGRLLEADGSPYAGEAIRVRVGATLERQLTTKRSGEFEFDALVGESFAISERERAESVRVFDDAGAELGRASLPAGPIGGSWFELGDIVTKANSIAVGGVVRDAMGRPQVGVWVYVAVDATDGATPRAAPAFVPDVTDEMGYFKVRDRAAAVVEAGETQPAIPRELCVVARKGNVSLGKPLPFRRTNDMEIIVEPRARAVGRLLVDPEVPAARLRVSVWDEANGPHEGVGSAGWISTLGDVDPNGTFRGPGVTPGSYTVAVSTPAGDAIEYVSGVHLEAGDVRDPRIDPIDLRGRLRVLELDVENDSGHAVAADVFALARDGALRRLGPSEELIVIDRKSMIESILVTSPGYCGMSLGNVEGSHSVTLTRGLTVAIDWPRSESLPELPIVAVATLTPRDLTALPGNHAAAEYIFRGHDARAVFSDQRVATLRVPAAGDYALEVYLEHDRDGYVDRAWVIEPRAPQIVSVNGAGAKIDINAPAAAFETARGALRK